MPLCFGCVCFKDRGEAMCCACAAAVTLCCHDLEAAAVFTQPSFGGTKVLRTQGNTQY